MIEQLTASDVFNKIAVSLKCIFKCNDTIVRRKNKETEDPIPQRRCNI